VSAGARVSLLVAGGGTAGHVDPALALAEGLRTRLPGARVTLLGTATGLESRLVPARGFALEVIPRVPLPRRPSPGLLTLPVRLAAAVRAAGEVMDRLAVTGVVGMGGYVSLPAYLAARRRRIPLVVHEANPRPGLANRVGARLTPWVAVSVPGTPLPHARLTGLPLPAEIAGLDRAANRQDARRELGLPSADRPTLLVTGGSQGARRINEAAAGAAERLLDSGYHTVHVTGPAHFDDTRAALERRLGSTRTADVTAPGGGYRLLPYAQRMALAYAAADLAVCRAGANTCAQLAAVGLPAVYVPLPIGNGEQQLNADAALRSGGGLVIDDAALDAATFATAVLDLFADPGRLAAMGAAARGGAPSDATGALVEMVLEACGMIGP
jgi:UDP-N-acetylglucosamine--N-acetylmuramyl-(pentapeptide) pyrophosphoryl-undecaprenol N-acetylglucosamine transferase